MLRIVYTPEYIEGFRRAQDAEVSTQFDPPARTVFVDLPGLLPGIGADDVESVVLKYLAPDSEDEQLLPILVLDGCKEGADLGELLPSSPTLRLLAKLGQ